MGDYIIRNVPIHTLDITDVASPGFNGLEIKGVICTRLLMHFLSTLDYANGALILRRVSLENLQSLEAQIAAGGTKVIPFWLIEMHYIGGPRDGQQPGTHVVLCGYWAGEQWVHRPTSM